MPLLCAAASKTVAHFRRGNGARKQTRERESRAEREEESEREAKDHVPRRPPARPPARPHARRRRRARQPLLQVGGINLLPGSRCRIRGDLCRERSAGNGALRRAQGGADALGLEPAKVRRRDDPARVVGLAAQDAQGASQPGGGRGKHSAEGEGAVSGGWNRPEEASGRGREGGDGGGGGGGARASSLADSGGRGGGSFCRFFSSSPSSAAAAAAALCDVWHLLCRDLDSSSSSFKGKKGRRGRGGDAAVTRKRNSFWNLTLSSPCPSPSARSTC